MAAAVGQKLLVALENFSAWKHLTGPVFFAQKFIPGNPIETAKKDLKERVEHYHQIDKDSEMLIAFSRISNKLGQLSRSPQNSDPIELKAKYNEIADRLKEANFQFTHEQTPGIQAVACGVLLPQILDCQNTLVNKFVIPLNNALSEVKALSSHYTISMSVSGLTLPQEHKAQPSSSPKESVTPVASHK